MQSDLNRADLRNANLSNTDLFGANLSHANLSKANLSYTNLSHADLSRANLSNTDLFGANLSHANLSKAIFGYANLINANLSHARMDFAILTYAQLDATNLSEADLSYADLSNTNLSYANFINADLSDANLSDANFSYAKLGYTDLSRATTHGTTFGSLDLRLVEGLETIKHEGPSIISTSTLEYSQGNIPEIFLRGAGLSDTFIEYAGSLVQSPIQFYSCFISYSSKDQGFAERLYADLQSKGVRCWYAPEDMKTGDKIRHRIDTSIRLHDKLLLILSEQSITSTWVEKEVETAFERESTEDKLILFPIKLDEGVMHTHQGWAADIRRMRHIGDFTNWKHHDSYQKAFERLLHDLKADTRR